jgi:hypothetical protein
VSDNELPFATRLWFVWACFFRVLFDGAFARRAFDARSPALPQLRETPPLTNSAPTKKPPKGPTNETRAPAPDLSPALQLLALLQREGRFIDFIEQDVASFPDAEIGAAARVVHEGCRRALRAHAKLTPIRSEDEGARVTLAAGFRPTDVKLTGNVGGQAPYAGVLVHRGWRAADVTLPTSTEGHDVFVLAPAEVEL